MLACMVRLVAWRVVPALLAAALLVAVRLAVVRRDGREREQLREHRCLHLQRARTHTVHPPLSVLSTHSVYGAKGTVRGVWGASP